MADYIFTQGTCMKSEMYGIIINSMIAAGWRNISSNATTDFDVLQSTGETGNKLLTIQMRPTSTTGTNSIITTDFNTFSYRLVETYTPGTNGSSGTFNRNVTVEPWAALYVAYSTSAISASTPLTYFIHVNKNRVILFIDLPFALNIAPTMFYMGLPDENYCSEPGSRGVLVATTSYPKTANALHITNAAGELASEAGSTLRTLYVQLAPKNPNSAGNLSLSEIKYGNANESYRGKLTGIFQLPNGNVSNGDITMSGAKKYRISVCATSGSFSTLTFAIQIE